MAGNDLDSGLRPFVSIFRVASFAFAIAAFAAALFSFFKRVTDKSGAGHLGPWNAATFRFTVGGMSAMLLLNLLFWTMTVTYLFREPIAHNLPGAVARIKLDETTSLKEALLDWKLYYTDVKDEVRFSNVTFWNTAGGFVKGDVSTDEARERLNAIDKWSLISQLFFPVAIMLFLANFVFILMGLISCQKRGLMDLFPHALLVPFYWVLISIAAVKGFWQLFWNPWYWEKTTHGLSPTHPLPPSTPPSNSSESPAPAAGE